jgi:hypothetical protein
MFELITDQARQWIDTLRNFDGTYKSVNDNVAALNKVVSSSSYPASLRTTAAGLLKDGQAAQSKMQALKKTRDTVVGWLRAVMPGSSTQLGFLPLVYVGVGIAAFVTAISLANKFLSGTATFAKQVSAYQAEQQRLVEQGVDPARAAELARQATRALADSSDKPGLFEKLGKNAIYVGGGVLLLVWLGPKILDRMSSRRGR